MSWITEYIIAPLLTGIIGGVAAGAFLLWQAPALSERFAQPTCDAPRDLIQIQPQEVLKQNGLRSSPTQLPREDEVGKGADRDVWNVRNLIDGSTNTVWVPADGSIPGASVEFEFAAPQELALICLVNGFPLNETYYYRANRIRKCIVSTDDGEARVSYLRTLSGGDIQNGQSLKFKKGRATRVTIKLESTTSGRAVEELNPDGSIVPRGPTKHTAIAEVEFYVSASD